MGRTGDDGRSEGGRAAGDEARRVRAAQEGSAAAFEGLVREHYPRVYATAFRLVGNHEDAEDLAQESFVRAHRAFAWYRGEGGFGAWLRTIVVHLARDRFRAAGRRPEAGGLALDALGAGRSEPATELTPAKQAGLRELARALDAALRRLPAHLRVPLVLRVLEGLDYEEIARATGVTPATARTQVMKARRALRRLLASHLGEGVEEERP